MRPPQLLLGAIRPIGWSLEPPIGCRDSFGPPRQSCPAPPAPGHQRAHPIADQEAETKRGGDVNEKLYSHALPLLSPDGDSRCVLFRL